MNDTSFKISVILPVYGGEQYLEQCLDSVLSQSYENLEIIIVNDGSPDSCPQIIDRYAKKDERIIAIHKDNAGYGAAINSGLDVATGDFVAIVETDDWVQLDMFERLVDAYIKKPNPVVKATFNRIRNEAMINTQSLSHLCDFDSDNLAEISPVSSVELFLLESSIWTALYKRDFLEENAIRLYESPGASYQDMPFKFICYAIADKITLLNEPVYNYRVMNEGSSSASSDKALISFNNYDVIKKFLLGSGQFGDYVQSFYFHHMFDLVFHSSRLKGEGLDKYLEKALLVFDEASQEGFDPNATSFSADTNDYYFNHVLPVYHNLMKRQSIKQHKTTNKFRRYVVDRMRFIASKLVIDPVVASLTAKIDNSLTSLSKDVFTKIDHLAESVEKNNTSSHVVNNNEVTSSELVKVHVAPTNQFQYYMRTYEERIAELRAEFRKGLDEFSLLNERKLFGFYDVLPYYEHQGLDLVLPLSLTLFTDEDRVILSNYDEILRNEHEKNRHLDLSELPITLATNYFKSGLKYLPEGISEQFKGKIAIDCGAWVGDTAIMFASFGFENVVALEPMFENYRTMQRNLNRNKVHLGDVIKPLNFAVGEEEGQLSMLKVGDDGVGSCVVNDAESDAITVRSITIDNLVQEYYPQSDIGLMKFDVEGYELNALKGAEETIRKNKPVLLISVYHLWLQPEQIFDCKRFVEELNMDYKFKFVHLQPEKDLVYEYMLVCW